MVPQMQELEALNTDFLDTWSLEALDMRLLGVEKFLETRLLVKKDLDSLLLVGEEDLDILGFLEDCLNISEISNNNYYFFKAH